MQEENLNAENESNNISINEEVPNNMFVPVPMEVENVCFIRFS